MKIALVISLVLNCFLLFSALSLRFVYLERALKVGVKPLSDLLIQYQATLETGLMIAKEGELSDRGGQIEWILKSLAKDVELHKQILQVMEK